MDNRVIISECWARDGLQSIPQIVPAEQKIRMINRFAQLGFQRIEATSFSNPKVVPQFADASEVLQGIDRSYGASFKATCVNEKAVDRAIDAAQQGYGPTEISFTISASQTHNLQNSKMTHEEHLGKLQRMMDKARMQTFRVIATIITAFGCPWEGDVPEERVYRFAEIFAKMGAEYICLGDTTGSANPVKVKRMFTELGNQFPQIHFIAHFHDTRGTGIANCVAAYESGVRYFDASIGGIGGQIAQAERRYQPGNGGNVCTEDLVCMFNEMGIDTGIDSQALLDCGRECEEVLNMELRSNVVRCGLVQH